MHCEFDKERVGFNPPLPNNAKVLANSEKEFFFFSVVFFLGFFWGFFFSVVFFFEGFFFFLKRVSESKKSLRHRIGLFFLKKKILSAIGCPILYQLQTSARRRRPGCQSTPSDYR